MIPPRGFVLGGAAALLMTFIAIGMQWPWPGAYGFVVATTWAGVQVLANKAEGVETAPGQTMHMMLGGAVVFVLSLLIP
jgi:hypothetical protein